MNRMTTRALIGAGLLSLAGGTATADETIKGITITPTKVVDGYLADTYDVQASFDIIREAKPDQTIYFSVHLREQDLGPDELFGPLTVCVAPNDWTQLAGGSFQAGIVLTFKGISDWYGTDWTVKGVDVDEVGCELALGHVGGGADLIGDNLYQYTYLLENDPTNSAMDPTLTVVAADVGDFHFDLDFQIPNGQAAIVWVDDTRPPMPDDEFIEVSTVPYVLHFSDGSTYEGMTIGPITGQLPCLADFNEDGTVNILDFIAFQNAFQLQDPMADVNNDGQFNVLDFITFQDLWEQGC